GNMNKDFAALMVIHHKGAIDMAELLLQKGEDAELKELAGNMIKEQQKEIGMFNSFLTTASTTQSDNKFYEEVMQQMHKMELDNIDSASVDVQFVKLMIHHHQGAVDMSSSYLSSGAKDEKLRTMAAKIIEDQRKEIFIMQDWLMKRNLN
ncbi:MAG TPA: DUF305 domain-containing protein, partial [Flavisolibacter sp.]|nr:DUF305 domain-containing protein [Flavisolibacter sp.]